MKTSKIKIANAPCSWGALEFDLEGEEAKWHVAIERLRKLHLVDGEYYINNALKAGKRILAEGAQGSMLDIDYGTYPFVTSSNTITAGVCTGLGVSPQKIGEVIGITKAYCTRVGSGPFPTELFDEMGEFLRAEGAEFGATTGRPRRCGWIDLPQLRYTIMLNGVTQLVVTKIDVLNKLPEIKMATAYETNGKPTQQLPFDLCDDTCQPFYESFPGWETDLERAATYGMLPETAQAFITELEEELEVPVTMVSTGPGRRQLLEKVQG